jgi:DNA-binding MarR family transcriptional regulator
MSVIQTIHQLEQEVTSVFKQRLSEAGVDLTPCQFLVLRAISENEGASQTQIVALTKVDRSTLADVVRRLVAMNLVLRNRNYEDARAYVLRVGPAGKKLVDFGNDIERQLASQLSGTGVTALSRALSALKPVEVSEAA